MLRLPEGQELRSILLFLGTGSSDIRLENLLYRFELTHEF
jgi:hypothetical protein